MLQLPRVGWRLLACENGASPDCTIVVVGTHVHGVSIFWSTSDYGFIGMQPVAEHLGVKTPGVPATPEPSMTKNSSSTRADLALNVWMDGARKMA